MTSADAFICHGLGTRFEDLPPSAIKAIKTFLLDTLGVGVAGANAPLTEKIRTAAALWGGSGSAHIWGQGTAAVTPAQAAFVNGFQIHCQEFDCVHEPAVVHPLATILAALTATAEGLERPVSGKEFAVALTVAVDLAAGLGVATKSAIRFFRPATAGIFGATLGCARINGFDAEQTASALGYALAFCSGTMQAHVEGKPALPVQIANAARGAVMACDLARLGMDGPRDVFDGPFGYLTLFEIDTELDEVADTLGQVWRIAEVSHKPFPTGRAAQGGIVLMQKLRAEGVRVDDIETLELSAPPLIKRLVGRPLTEDMTANYARLCFQYSGAVALIKGTVGLDDFTGEALRDPAVRGLGARIRVTENHITDPAAFTPQTATATLRNGACHTVETHALYGSPADPMSHEAHLEKFRTCLAFGLGDDTSARADHMIALTDTLEDLKDIRELTKLAAGLEGPTP